MNALKQLAEQNKIIEKIGFHAMLNLIKACQALDVVSQSPDEGNDVDGNTIGTSPNPVTNPLDLFVGGRKMNMWSMISGILPGKDGSTFFHRRKKNLIFVTGFFAIINLFRNEMVRTERHCYKLQ